jgi:glutamate N-acetyltransferase/amino-acid N-acetyltransferase
VAGIKPSGKKDLALIYSSTPARAAAVFTSNQVKGAPVLVSAEHVRGGQAQAIVASSGCANVCTGEQGIKDAREMTRLVGELLRIPANHVLIAATGVIGVPLPMDKIRGGAAEAREVAVAAGRPAAAEAIMTTDTVAKEAALRVEIGGRPVTIGGIAKGRRDARTPPGHHVLFRGDRRGRRPRCPGSRCEARRRRVVQPGDRRFGTRPPATPWP